MRCYGYDAGDCCNFYSSQRCVSQCLSPFVANSESLCVCPLGRTGQNCEITSKKTCYQNVYRCVLQVCVSKAHSMPTVDCGQLADPANGVVLLNDTVFLSTAIYFCSKGYTLQGNATRTCLASGDWSSSQPSCELVCVDKPQTFDKVSLRYHHI